MSALDDATLARWREDAEKNVRRNFGGVRFLSSEQTVAVLDALEEAQSDRDTMIRNASEWKTLVDKTERDADAWFLNRNLWQKRAEAAEAERDRLQARVDEALAWAEQGVRVTADSDKSRGVHAVYVEAARILSTPTDKEAVL